MRLTSVGLIGLQGNITSKDVTCSSKMAVIRTFFMLNIGDYGVTGIKGQPTQVHMIMVKVYREF